MSDSNETPACQIVKRRKPSKRKQAPARELAETREMKTPEELIEATMPESSLGAELS